MDQTEPTAALRSKNPGYHFLTDHRLGLRQTQHALTLRDNPDEQGPRA